MNENKEKKIGILTYFNAHNYGADLQCFALQRKLRNMDYDVEVINLRRPIDSEYNRTPADSERFKQLYSYKGKRDFIFKRNRLINKFIKNIISILLPNRIEERNKVFDEFLRSNISFSNITYLNFSELYNDSGNLPYTHYITGSDQVWNYSNSFSVEPYFLTFINKVVKISYAASIGHSKIPIEIQKKFKDWLSDFDFISLRERQGKDLVKDITQRDDIKHILDPVFLLTKEEWRNALDIQHKQNEKYVLVYLRSNSKHSIKLAKKLAKKLKCKVKVINSNIISYIAHTGVEYILGKNQKDFLELFYNATFVITNSFHGTAFSINFNIPFVTTIKKNNRVNSRLYSILEELDILDRLVFDNEIVDIESYLPFNYENTNKIIDKKRSFALDFLKESLT